MTFDYHHRSEIQQAMQYFAPIRYNYTLETLERGRKMDNDRFVWLANNGTYVSAELSREGTFDAYQYTTDLNQARFFSSAASFSAMNTER